jgi:hypothetical protein
MICNFEVASISQNVCVDFEPSFNLIEARDVSKTSNETLGQAVSLLVRDGGSNIVLLRPSPEHPADAITNEHTIGIQPGVSSGPSPYFEFNDADCVECDEEADCTVSPSNVPYPFSLSFCLFFFAAPTDSATGLRLAVQVRLEEEVLLQRRS